MKNANGNTEGIHYLVSNSFTANYKAKEKKDDGTYSFHFSKCRTKKLALKLGVMSCHCHWNRIGTQRELSM